jgi:CheY-like chemotaxis protein
MKIEANLKIFSACSPLNHLREGEVHHHRRSMSRKSEQVDVYLNRLGPEQRNSLERLRLFVLGVLPDVVETMRSGRVAYEHDCTMLCEADIQEDCISLHIAERDVLNRHRDKLEGLNVQQGYIRFRRFEDLPLNTLELVLKEAVHSREHPWLEKLGDCLKKWGTGVQRSVLCIGVAAEIIQFIQSIAEREASASILRDIKWTQGNLDSAYRERPDLILIDFDMQSQGMDGWETLEQIKRTPRLKDVPVIAIFASRRLHDGRPLFSSLSGPFADACLFKPFSPDDLARALCEALGYVDAVSGSKT